MMERKRKCYKQWLHFGQMPRVGEKGQGVGGVECRGKHFILLFCFICRIFCQALVAVLEDDRLPHISPLSISPPSAQHEEQILAELNSQVSCKL